MVNVVNVENVENVVNLTNVNLTNLTCDLYLLNCTDQLCVTTCSHFVTIASKGWSAIAAIIIEIEIKIRTQLNSILDFNNITKWGIIMYRLRSRYKR